MKKGPNSKTIYGKDADLLKAGFTLASDAILQNLEKLRMHPDPMFPRHRPWLSAKESLTLVHLTLWDEGYKTYDKPFPSLAYLAEKCHMSFKHAIKVIRFLERQGLILVRRSISGGLAHRFDLSPLKEKIRTLLGLKKRSKAFQVVEQPSPEPEPEPEPEPLPPAADLPPRAPEWELALPEIQRRVTRAEFQTWFEGTCAYWYKGLLVIEVLSTYQRQRLLMSRFSELIDSLFGAGCWAVHVAKASA